MHEERRGPWNVASLEPCAPKRYVGLFVLLSWLTLASLFLIAMRPQTRMPLGEVRTYMYQFQKMENAAAVELLAKSTYDLLVVEPVGTYRSGSLPDMKAMVSRLRGNRP